MVIRVTPWLNSSRSRPYSSMASVMSATKNSSGRSPALVRRSGGRRRAAGPADFQRLQFGVDRPHETVKVNALFVFQRGHRQKVSTKWVLPHPDPPTGTNRARRTARRRFVASGQTGEQTRFLLAGPAPAGTINRSVNFLQGTAPLVPGRDRTETFPLQILAIAFVRHGETRKQVVLWSGRKSGCPAWLLLGRYWDAVGVAEGEEIRID